MSLENSSDKNLTTLAIHRFSLPLSQVIRVCVTNTVLKAIVRSTLCRPSTKCREAALDVMNFVFLQSNWPVCCNTFRQKPDGLFDTLNNTIAQKVMKNLWLDTTRKVTLNLVNSKLLRVQYQFDARCLGATISTAACHF